MRTRNTSLRVGLTPYLSEYEDVDHTGISLKEKLEGYTLLETHPRTVQKMLGIITINQHVNDRYKLDINPSEQS